MCIIKESLLDWLTPQGLGSPTVVVCTLEMLGTQYFSVQRAGCLSNPNLMLLKV